MTTFSLLDQRITRLVKELPSGVAPIMDGLSFVGEPLTVLAVAVASFISAVIRGQQAEQTAYMLGFLAFVVGTLMKLVLKRRRPPGRVIRNFGIDSYSFPSGHAFGTMIFYGLLGLVDDKYLSSPWNILLATLIVVLIFLIGVSRIYKGAHFPSDVLAGWLLGAISLLIVYMLTL